MYPGVCYTEQADEVMCLDAIGEGPFGTVYEGRYRGSTVAVKKMRMTAMPLKQAARENMEMELEVEATRMGTYVTYLLTYSATFLSCDSFRTDRLTL